MEPTVVKNFRRLYLSCLVFCFPQVFFSDGITRKDPGASLRRITKIQSNNFDGSHSVPGTYFFLRQLKLVGFRGPSS